MSSLPKVSCLTVTLDRLELLKEAIRCYCEQTYAQRELVIVTDGSSHYARSINRHLEALARDDIRLVHIEGRRSLGELRNLSLEEATGDLVCQWDDDDLNHPERLRAQLTCLQEAGADACMFTDELHFFTEARELYWVDWSTDGVVREPWQWIPGTLMARRDLGLRYPETGPAAVRGEDSALVDTLERDRIATLHGSGQLIVYAYHGANTFDRAHHSLIVQRHAIESTRLRARLPQLLEALRSYRLPLPFVVKGNDGAIVHASNSAAASTGRRAS